MATVTFDVPEGALSALRLSPTEFVKEMRVAAACCGHTEMFESAEAAFRASWDVAPRFTVQPLCDLCLTTPIPLYGLEGARNLHAAAHAHWKEHGRGAPIDENAPFEPSPDLG